MPRAAPADRDAAGGREGRCYTPAVPCQRQQPPRSHARHDTTAPHRRGRRRHRRRRPDDDPGPQRARVPRRRAAPARLRRGRPAGRSSIDGQTHEVGEADARGVRGRRHRALLGRRRHLARARARRPRHAARRSSTTRPRGGWIPTIPLVVSQVNPDDLEGHPGIIANPNCSTMQLVPVLMALRDSVGLERVVVDTYQAVSGTGAEAIAELEGQIRAHVAGEPKQATVYPHPIAFNALPADRRLPRQRLHEGGVEGRHREPQDPPPAGPADLVHGRPRPGLRRPLRGGPRRDARADHPRPGPRAVRRRSPGVVVQDDPSTSTYPLATDAAGTRRDLRRPRPPGPVRSPTAAGSRSGSCSDNLRKGAATNAVQIAEVLVERGWVRSAPRAAPRRTGAPSGAAASRARRDRRRAPGGARGDRGRGPRLHPLPPPRDPDAGRARARAAPTPRSCSSARARASTRIAQGRPFVGRAGDLLVEAASARIGWRREDVFITNVVKCRPPDNRDPEPDEIAACAPYLQRQLEVLDPAADRDARPALDGPVHARRADLPGARHDRARSIPATGAPRRARSSRCTTRRPRSARPEVERQSYDDVAPASAAACSSARARRDAPRRANRAGRAPDVARLPADSPTLDARERRSPRRRRADVDHRRPTDPLLSHGHDHAA